MLKKNYKKNKFISRPNKGRKFTYSAKTYSNPFFESKRNKRAKSNVPSIPLKIKLIFFAVLSVIVLVVWFLVYSSYFSIKTIEARGGGRISPNEIHDLAWSQINDSDFVLWPQKNIFLFNKNELIETLNLKYSFNDIIVNKKLPDKLIIQYNEKDYSMVWYEKELYYYIDENGYVVSKIGEKSEEKNYPVYKNVTENFIEGNHVAINKNLIGEALDLIEKFKVYNDFEIDFFEARESDNIIYVKIKEGPYLYIDIYGDTEKQLNKIIKLKGILEEDFFKRQYIDVTIGDSVYYK